MQGHTLKGVYLQLSNSSQAERSFDFLLGGISLYDNQIKEENLKVNLKNCVEYIKSISARFSPDCTYGAQKSVDVWIELGISEQVFQRVKMIRIFKDDQWLLSTLSQEIFVESMPLEGHSDFQIKVQLVLNNGYHYPVESIQGREVKFADIKGIF